MNTLSDFLPTICQLARKAGAAILEKYEQGFSVTTKDDRTPLTEADMAAHHIIVDALTELTPDIPVLSEESEDIPFTTRQTWQRYWLIDPLDGTREFISRNGEFTVNIALIEDGMSILGVIYCPVKDLMFYAARGAGAFRERAPDTPTPIHTRNAPTEVISVAGSRSHAGESLNNFLSKIPKVELLSLGSSLKSCLVAEGAVDIYPRFGPTSEWDTGAAQCIVEEAGGQVLTLDMQPLRYNTKESLLNPHFIVIGDQQYNWGALLG
jgi:3'(2'), 5'-bisphosphate nucleotidase